MLERLTPDAAKAVLFAQEEARRLGHNYVDSEILLLGLIAVSIPPAAHLPDAVVPSLKAARKAVESIIGRGSDFVSRDPPFTPVAQRVIKSASQEARGGHVSSEHIFRALLCEGDSDAVHILDALSVDRALVADALKCLNDNAQAATALEASPESVQWEEDDRPCTQEEALSRVFGLNSFIKAKSVPAGMLSWFDEKDEILGCYINAEDDLLSGRLSAHLKRACDKIATSSLNGSTKVSDVGCMTPPIWRCLCQETQSLHECIQGSIRLAKLPHARVCNRRQKIWRSESSQAATRYGVASKTAALHSRCSYCLSSTETRGVWLPMEN